MPRRPVWDDVPRTTAGKFAPRQRIDVASGPGLLRMITVVIFTLLVHIVLASTVTAALNLRNLAMVLTFIGILIAGIIIGFMLSRSWRWFFLYIFAAFFAAIIFASLAA